MASHNKSGTSPKQRSKLLRKLGFSYKKNGNGGHQIWIHEELEALSKKYDIKMPDNLRICTGDWCAWEIILPSNPAKGTWIDLKKKANWASNKVKEIENPKSVLNEESNLKAQFQQTATPPNKALIEEWKKAVKHAIKSGIEPPDRNIWLAHCS